MRGQSRKDLYVLVADQDMVETMAGLLNRTKSLRIRRIRHTISKHLNRDSGCRTDATRYLRSFISTCRYALIIFDRHGCGSDGSCNEIQSDVERDLAANGWRDRSKAIVIDPELENWVWNGSNQVPRVLGCGSSYEDLRTWLHAKGLWPSNCDKPPNPKKSMRAALRHGKRKFSAKLFGDLAKSTTLATCNDRAFNELGDTLRLWFPMERRR